MLLGVEVSRCMRCGVTEVAIPAIEDLHRAIARAIILKPAKLVPEEVRFLRKHIGLRAQDLAGHLGVAMETVSRWENGKLIMQVPTERLLRFMAAQKEPVERYEQELPKVATKKPRRSKLGMRHNAAGWRPVAAA